MDVRAPVELSPSRVQLRGDIVWRHRYATHYQMGPQPKLSKRAIEARNESENQRLARLPKECVKSARRTAVDIS